MAAPIKALLLDLGNVTVRLRSEHFGQALLAACRPGTTAQEAWAAIQDPQGAHYQYERGRMDGPAFHLALQKGLGLSLGYAAWLRLWNDYFEPNRPMEALLARLRGQLRFWGLSNTNAEHLAFLRLNYRALGLFEGMSASNEVGAAKPEAAIFQHAIRGLGLEPEQVLYLDDVGAYIEAGKGQGLQAFHYTFNDQELHGHLERIGVEMRPLGGNSTMAC